MPDATRADRLSGQDSEHQLWCGGARRPFLPAYGASKAALNHLSKSAGDRAWTARYRDDRAVSNVRT